MKIRHPWLIKGVGLGAAWLVSSWMSSLRVRYRDLGEQVNPYTCRRQNRYLYAIWHENLLFPVHYFRRAGICYLVSYHADGQILAEVGRHLRVPLVRGSTRKGGVEAVRRLMRLGKRFHVAMTPDGPKGPRRQLQPGLVYLSARTGMPIVPTGIGYQRPWRLQSWDQMAIPKPWTVVTVVAGNPIRVPENVDKQLLEPYRWQAEQQMHHVTQFAEEWANETVDSSPMPSPRRNAVA